MEPLIFDELFEAVDNIDTTVFPDADISSTIETFEERVSSCVWSVVVALIEVRTFMEISQRQI